MGTAAALHCSTGVAGYSPWLYAAFLSGADGTRLEAEARSLHQSYLTNATSAPATVSTITVTKAADVQSSQNGRNGE